MALILAAVTDAVAIAVRHIAPTVPLVTRIAVIVQRLGPDNLGYVVLTRGVGQ